MSLSNHIVSGDSAATATTTTTVPDATIPKTTPTPAISMTSTAPSPTLQLPSSDSASTASSNKQQSSPSPLQVGTRFVKQYYKTLSSTPEQIVRFYEPSSVLSVGVGSATSTTPMTLEQVTETAIDGEQLKDRFFPKNDDVELKSDEYLIRFEFENGAIDAQQSVYNSILLVVTGSVVYVKDQLRGEKCEIIKARKAFVHTFFLCSTMVGGKVSYYVHNDILRFLHTPEQEEVEEPVPKTLELPSEMLHAADGKENNTNKVENGTTKPKKKHDPKEETQQFEEVQDDTSIGLDKPKEEGVTGNNAARKEAAAKGPQAATEKSKQKKVKTDKKSSFASPRDEKDISTPKPKSGPGTVAKTPNPKESTVKPGSSSWASLVATPHTASSTPSRSPMRTNSVPSPSPQTTNTTDTTTITSASNDSRKQKQQPGKKQNDNAKASTKADDDTRHGQDSNIKQEQQPKSRRRSGGAANKTTTTTATPNASTITQTVSNTTSKRNPDFTLILRNIPVNTMEKDVLDLLEAKKPELIGCTVLARGTAFVDYRSSNPVLKVLALHAKTPFVFRGQTLEIHQKSNDPHQQQHSLPQSQQQNKSSNNRRRNSRGREAKASNGEVGADSGDRDRKNSNTSKEKSGGDEKLSSNQNVNVRATNNNNKFLLAAVENKESAQKGALKNNNGRVGNVGNDRQQTSRGRSRGNGGGGGKSEGRQGVRSSQ